MLPPAQTTLDTWASFETVAMMHSPEQYRRVYDGMKVRAGAVVSEILKKQAADLWVTEQEDQ